MKTKNFADILRKKIAADPVLAERVEDATLNSQIAAEIFEARTDAHLTQSQLAELAGTTQSVIARLEDADYDGHSIKTLQKIANALKKQLHVGFYAKSSFTTITSVKSEVNWVMSQPDGYAQWGHSWESVQVECGLTHCE